MSAFFAAVRMRAMLLLVALVSTTVLMARPASAQNVFYAGIAYSQSTGKIGYTARQARTEAAAKELAERNCGTPDAKTFIWGPNQWVAIAIIEGRVGTAGFGRGNTSDEAQSKALAECKKRAGGAACRVAFCIHSQGMRPRQLRSLPADVTASPAARSGFYAAIAFSPATGKVGHTAGKARTKEEAQQLALKDCNLPDARVFMWGNEWVAIAVCDSHPGVAGFGPGATREAAQKQALAECQKRSRGAPCRIALAIHSSGAPTDAEQPKPRNAAPQTPPSTPTPAAPPATPGQPRLAPSGN